MMMMMMMMMVVVVVCATSLDLSCRFDAQSLCAFVGDYSGQISVLKISRTSFELLTVLKGHTGIASRCVDWRFSFYKKTCFCTSHSEMLI